MRPRNRGFTLTEFLIAGFVAVLLFGSVWGTFVTSRSVFTTSLEAAGLQRDVNVVMQKIIRGRTEGSDLSGLRSSESFIIPVATPPGSEIDFTGTDNQQRRYFLSGKSIVYSSPVLFPSQRTIYTAPADTDITLRFWEPAGYMDNETVGIYVSISKQSGGKTISGSLSTYLNLRNIQK